MSSRNRYLLAPWMPIDVRLPALAGVLGMGTYLYLERVGRIDEAKEWADKVRTDAEANLQTARTSITSAWQSAQLDKWLPNRRGTSSSIDADNEIKPDSPLEGAQRYYLRALDAGTSRLSIIYRCSHHKPAGVHAAETASQSPDAQHEAATSSDEATTVTEQDVRRIDNLMQEAILGRTIPDPSDEDSTDTAANVMPDKIVTAEEVLQEPPGPLQALQDITAQIDQAVKATAEAMLPSPSRPEASPSRLYTACT